MNQQANYNTKNPFHKLFMYVLIFSFSLVSIYKQACKEDGKGSSLLNKAF